MKRRYGVCFADGTIRIRLRHAVTGRPLTYSSLVNTLCHELAHLRHFNHGLRFQRFYFEILEYARDRGIYRPGGEPEPARALPAAAAEERARAAVRPRAAHPVREGGLGRLLLLVVLLEGVRAVDELDADVVAGDRLVEDLADEARDRDLVVLGERVLEARCPRR